MKQPGSLSDPLASYMAHAVHGADSFVAKGMAGTIPASVAGSVSLALENLGRAGRTLDEAARERAGKIFRDTTRRAGALTSRALDSLEAFMQGAGSIEVAHQPKFLGGEKFVFNKVALGHALEHHARTAINAKLVPFFYLADHDKVHPELVKTHFSSCNAATGFHASIDPDVERAHDGTAIRALPVPTTAHLDQVLDTIRGNYTFAIATCVQDPFQKALLEERLGEALRLIKLTHATAGNYNAWFLSIVGILSNVYSDHGYLFIEGSDPAFRQEQLPHYEMMTRDRERYVSLYTGLRDALAQHGYEPPLRPVTADFVPFFVECRGKECNARRIQLKAETTGSRVILQGRCDGCGETVDIVTSSAHPDLSDHAGVLCPRVESRQYIVSKTLAPAIHVAGTGEARYYTMSIPLLRSFDPATFLPVIHYYNKLTTNTFITRYLEERLISMNTPGFLDGIKGVMRLAGKFNALAKKGVRDGKNLVQARTRAIEILEALQARVGEVKRSCQEPTAPGMPEGMDQVSKVYSAMLFGTIAKERHGQEPAFHWMDIALHAGMGEFFGAHDKLYQPWLPPGLEAFF